MSYKIDEVVDFDSLVCVAHAMAIDKGWWEGERRWAECWANFHAEVSEAWEEYRCGRMATWYAADAASVLRSGGVPKPEGFWVEIGDLMIRVADYFGAAKYEQAWDEPEVDGVHWANVTAGVIVLHDLIAKREFDELIAAIEAFAAAHNVDLWSIIREKLRYNATRPHRHGGKRA